MSALVGFGPSLAWRLQQDERKCGFQRNCITRVLSVTRRRLCVLGVSKCCRTVGCRASLDSWEEESGKCHCWCGCGRRHILASMLGMPFATVDGVLRAAASAEGLDDSYLRKLREVHPKRPDWYEEFYARALKFGMVSYEAEVAKYKEKLFEQLKQGPASETTVVELGIGTGPNLKYYVRGSGMNVVGIDPTEKMEKYARDAAAEAGLSSSNFNFVHAVGEEIPLPTSSADTVISTLVLCSVTDLNSTLQEVKRILKPGATFYFLEHVAAPEGSSLRFWQTVLDPVQQFVADGCHLTRDTLSYIQSAGFPSIQAQQIKINSAFLLSPHIIGTAQSSQV